MRKNIKKIFVGIMAVTMLGSICQIQTEAATKKSTQYKMVWSDEFNGSTLNRSNWKYDIGNGGSNIGWGNNEHQYYTDRTDNVSVKDGKLVITAKSEDYTEEGTGHKYDYTSGRILSSGLQSFKYGKIEAKIKVASVKGLWPAFWMLGYNDKGWPFCGEIDILETWNALNFAQGTIHWVNENGSKPTSDTYDASSTMLANKADWHTYGLTWTPDYMKWYVDNKVYKTFSLKSSDKSELKAQFYIILNMAVGGNLPYFTPDEGFVSANTEVDYVRAYQRESDNGTYSGTWTSEEKAQVPAYTVKFVNGKKTLSTQKILAGENTLIPTTKKSRYKFLGWYNGKNKITADKRINSNFTAKAKWKKIKVNKAKITSTKQKYKKVATVRFKVKSKVDGYQIKIGSKKYFTDSKGISAGKFKSGKTYSVKVRAYSVDSRSKKIYGKWSDSKKITIK